MFDSSSSASDINVELDGVGDIFENDLNFVENADNNNNNSNVNIKESSNVNSEYNNKNNKSKHHATKLKLGLSIASVNARGLVANPDHRTILSSWMRAHNTDVMCVQEYYVPHEHNKVEFDMSNFNGYNLVQNEHNSKTLIIYKKNLWHESLDDIGCDIDGIDSSWLAIFDQKIIIIIGSIYHSPDRKYDFNYDILSRNKELIIQRYKNDNRKILFQINGDFNSKHDIWGSSITDDRGINALDWTGKEHLHVINDGSPTYINSTSMKEDALDLSLISLEHRNTVARWKVHKDLRQRHNFSDHYVLEILLKVNPIMNDTPDRITWNFDENKIDEFNENLKIKMKKWRFFYDRLKYQKRSVNKLTSLFQLLFVQAGMDVFGLKKYNSQAFKWISKKVLNLIEQKKKVCHQLSHLIAQLKRKMKTAIIVVANIPRKLRIYWKKLKNKVHKFDKRIFRAKQDSILKSTAKIEKAINNKGAKCDKTFWKIANRITNTVSDSIPPQRDEKTDKILATTTLEIARHLHTHFIKPLQDNKDKYKPRHIRFHEKVDNYMETYKYNNNQNNSIVNRRYSKQEVLKVINDLNKDSAMSFDFIHFKLLKWSKYVILENLTLLFNLCFFDHQVYPTLWKHGEYIPIPKPGRPAKYSKNVRPICIIPGLARVISKINCNRVLTDCIDRKLLDPRNCAFQKNKSTEDIYLALTEKILQSFQNGHFTELQFLDLGSAYDSVKKNSLLYKLIHEYGFDGNIIAWMDQQCTARNTRVKLNGVVTEWRPGRDNLPQGMPDSIGFFILLYNNVKINKTKNARKNKSKYNIKSIKLNVLKQKNEKNICINSKKLNTGDNNKKKQKYLNYETKTFNFDIDFSTFADDSSLETQALPVKVPLTNQLKRNQRLASSLAVEDLFDYTRYWRLIIRMSKCSTAMFTRRRIRAYVFKLDGEYMECSHAVDNAPQCCKHNEKIQYMDGALQLDDNYESEILVENNGDSDLDNLDENGEKIVMENKNRGDVNIDVNSGKQQKYGINQLPLSTRILGVLIDPKLFFNEHLKMVMKTVNYKLHKLRQIAYCKYYNFTPHTINKLYQSVIRSKMEYALCTVANERKVKILQRIQNRANKLALQIKKDVPTMYVNEMVNCKSIQYRLDVARIKLWHKYKRSPNTSMKHGTFNKWKSYILNNGGNINECKKLRNRQIGRDEAFKIDDIKHNFVKKSPLSQAYKLMDKITPIKVKIFSARCPNVLKPPPTYHNIFPMNVNTFMWHNDDDYNNDNKLWTFYTDGSCVPNPGPGGSAYYSDDFDTKAKMCPINHDTTINYCELNGIYMIYKDCIAKLQNSKYLSNVRKNINIFTDSKFVINVLSMDGYPQLNYYYNLIDKMNNLANILNSYNIDINIFKVSSHKGLYGNEMADILANQASTIAYNCKYRLDDTIHYSTYYNPIGVDISKDIIKLNKMYKKERKHNWIERDQLWRSNKLRKNIYTGNMILHKYFVDFDGVNYDIKRRSNAIMNSLKFLKQYECEIINKLRTEHINLNDYKKKRFDDTNGKCKYCNVKETVSHFLLDCPGNAFEDRNNFEVDYIKCRWRLRKELKRISIFFKYEHNFNCKNLLFPHVWQDIPRKSNPNYNKIKEDNERRETAILRAVVRYVQDTLRFRQERYSY